MAAGVAALIRGLDVVEDAQNLRVIAAESLDITPLSFGSVIETLEQAGMVGDVKRSGNRIESFTESVPYAGDLYGRLGSNWRDSAPTDLERQVVTLVNRLAHAPLAAEEVVDELGLDKDDMPAIYELADQTSLIKRLEVSDGTVLYSPFFGFENPTAISDAIVEHGTSELSDAFASIRGEQGMPLSKAGKVVTDAVARGLMMAPSVELPSGKFEAFATLPYTIDAEVLKGDKPVMEKALAVIACFRTGQHFGGFSSFDEAGIVQAISKLLSSGYINPHSSSERQYRTLNRAGVIKLAPDTRPNGSWKTPTLIDTRDNRAALELARDLLTHGEPMASRVPNNLEMTGLLDASNPYGTPMKTVKRYRDKQRMTDRSWQSAIDKLMGHRS